MNTLAKRPYKMRSIPFWVRVVAVVLVLTMALAYMVAERIKILTNGIEVVLVTKPVDPRDLFRGHYARLRFDISDVVTPIKKYKRNDPVYVRLKSNNNEHWSVVSIHPQYPDQKSAAAAGTVVIKGRVKHTYASKLAIEYGIERYFAPKAQALNLEKLSRDKVEISTIVRVSKSGEAAISGLIIDGKKVYEEPLF